VCVCVCVCVWCGVNRNLTIGVGMVQSKQEHVGVIYYKFTLLICAYVVI